MKINQFNLQDVLDSGQTFRYERLKDGRYLVLSKDQYGLFSEQKGEFIMETENEAYFKHFFDLENDYTTISKEIIKKHEKMKEILKYTNGIRLLKQDTWEMILSFILSSNNNIPRIKGLVKNICEKYGQKIVSVDQKDYFSFPTPEEMKKATLSELRSLGVGFRDQYIIDARDKIRSQEISIEDLRDMGTQDARLELMKIKGVGKKVADCVLLFGLNKTDVFPVDVWIERIMRDWFVPEDLKKNEIETYAFKMFGEQMGYAQQYIFYYCITKYREDLKNRSSQL